MAIDVEHLETKTPYLCVLPLFAGSLQPGKALLCLTKIPSMHPNFGDKLEKLVATVLPSSGSIDLAPLRALQFSRKWANKLAKEELGVSLTIRADGTLDLNLWKPFDGVQAQTKMLGQLKQHLLAGFRPELAWLDKFKTRFPEEVVHLTVEQYYDAEDERYCTPKLEICAGDKLEDTANDLATIGASKPGSLTELLRACPGSLLELFQPLIADTGLAFAEVSLPTGKYSDCISGSEHRVDNKKLVTCAIDMKKLDSQVRLGYSFDPFEL